MKFTFGIITNGQCDENINTIIDSIEKQNIPHYQILVIGDSHVERCHTTVIPFDETIKPSWITKKKNLITKYAKYENIVYLHDYIIFDDNWYEGFLKFGEDFKVCMNVILNLDSSRFRDWILFPYPDSYIRTQGIVKTGRQGLLPYDLKNLSKHQYISGAYWVAKKYVMEEFPLDETRLWSQGEDLIWSLQVREKYNFSINTFSTVKLLKQKDVFYVNPPKDAIQKLRELDFSIEREK